jgi:hypothetical protein
VPPAPRAAEPLTKQMQPERIMVGRIDDRQRCATNSPSHKMRETKCPSTETRSGQLLSALLESVAVAFDEFIGSMSNTQIAKALDLIAPRLDSELAQAIMIEAARRLRGEPEPHFAGPLLPDLPPLKAQAIPDADTTSQR